MLRRIMMLSGATCVLDGGTLTREQRAAARRWCADHMIPRPARWTGTRIPSELATVINKLDPVASTDFATVADRGHPRSAATPPWADRRHAT